MIAAQEIMAYPGPVEAAHIPNGTHVEPITAQVVGGFTLPNGNTVRVSEVPSAGGAIAPNTTPPAVDTPAEYCEAVAKDPLEMTFTYRPGRHGKKPQMLAHIVKIDTSKAVQTVVDADNHPTGETIETDCATLVEASDLTITPIIAQNSGKLVANGKSRIIRNLIGPAHTYDMKFPVNREYTCLKGRAVRYAGFREEHTVTVTPAGKAAGLEEGIHSITTKTEQGDGC
jgi:hypothetical protein